MKISATVAALGLAAMTAAYAAETPRVQFAKRTFDIQRSLPQGGTTTASVGSVFYTETSRGSDAYFLDTPFSHHPMLAPNIDITTAEALITSTIDGAAAYCTTRVIGRDTQSLICFADTDGDGSVDQWRKVQRTGRPRSTYMREQDLLPDVAQTMPPIHISKAIAEPKTGEEGILEIRYMGLSDGKAKFKASLRLGNQLGPLKQADTLVPLNAAGQTLVMIDNPFAPPALTALATLFAAKPGSSPGSVQMAPPILILDVAKATDQSAVITVRQQYPDWRYWRLKDETGKNLERTMLGGPAGAPQPMTASATPVIAMAAARSQPQTAPAMAAVTTAQPQPASAPAGAVDLMNRDNVARSVFVCGDGCDIFSKHGQKLTLVPGEIKKDVCIRDCLILMSETDFMSMDTAMAELKAGHVYSGDVMVAVVNGKIEGPKPVQPAPPQSH